MKMRKFGLIWNKWLNYLVENYRTIRKHMNNALHKGLNNLVVGAKFANTTINDNC